VQRQQQLCLLCGVLIQQLTAHTQQPLTYFLCCVVLCCAAHPQVRLAKEAQEAARTAVELDPSNDLAHHLMGRWHFEMAQINFVLRQVSVGRVAE
jgi:hypothetical protein